MKNNERLKYLMLKKAAPLALAGMLVFGSNGVEAQAKSVDSEKVFEVDGYYTMNPDTNPLYIYLGNVVPNKYLKKNDAISLMSQYYEKLYVHRRIETRAVRINGRESYESVDVYAISPNYFEKDWGWSIDTSDIKENTMVATSIELGNILIDEKLNRQNKFKLIDYDLNNDGEYEKVAIVSKAEDYRELPLNEALNYAKSKWQPYFLLRRIVLLPNGKRVYKYAVSNRGFLNVENGWLMVNEDSVPSDTIVATDTYVYDAMYDMVDTLPTLKVIGENLHDIDPDDYYYSYKSKNKALKYAYKNFKSFCIVTKEVLFEGNYVDVYAFTQDVNSYNKDGWKLAYNDEIPSNAYIFLDTEYAENYLILAKHGYAKKLLK